MSAPIARRLFERYVRRLAARHFAGVHWQVRDAPERWDRALPTLFVANHSNWWDGFLAFLVSRRLGIPSHLLMDARQLARYRVFARVGALPLRRDRARSAYADLEAATRHLVPGAGLWIFPQGERRPPGERLRAGRGAAYLALSRAPIRVCPVGFRYAYIGEQLPEAFVIVGEAWVRRAEPGGTRKAVMPEIATRLETTLAVLDELVAAERLDAFQPLTPGSLSINKRLDRVRHLLGLLAGPFEARNG